MGTDIFKLNLKDVTRSLISTLFTSFFGALGIIINNKLTAQEYSFTMNDLHLLLALALFTFLGSVSRKFLSDSNDKLGRKI